ncbi:MAG TPA: hypothetical protein ENG92_03340 [Thiolapillus brandeum]|uniref:Uncharacterized protein n=1 Tax=Thiolapillus brandeum TaxID=1076588 RepID=A0A831NTH4_9GAMM|nr:hypothetical protein [Thiolapillus brandeum]
MALTENSVIPAHAGIQEAGQFLDSGLRQNDGYRGQSVLPFGCQVNIITEDAYREQQEKSGVIGEAWQGVANRGLLLPRIFRQEKQSCCVSFSNTALGMTAMDGGNAGNVGNISSALPSQHKHISIEEYCSRHPCLRSISTSLCKKKAPEGANPKGGKG